MGLLFLCSAACCLKRFLVPQLTSTVGKFRTLNIYCAMSAPIAQLFLINIVESASQHAPYYDHYFTVLCDNDNFQVQSDKYSDFPGFTFNKSSWHSLVENQMVTGPKSISTYVHSFLSISVSTSEHLHKSLQEGKHG